jgi:hypothetical protein
MQKVVDESVTFVASLRYTVQPFNYFRVDAVSTVAQKNEPAYRYISVFRL